MKKLSVLSSLILLLFCSSQPEMRKIYFKPELTIGENTETEGAWFSNLNDFYVDSERKIYCVDGEDKKIKVFDKAGKPLFSFGQKGQGPGEFSYPMGIAVSRSGNIYVMDNGRRNISKFTSNGEYVTSLNIGHPLAKIEIFDSGNLVVEIAKIDITKDLRQSQFVLRLFNPDLKEIQKSIYEKPVIHLAWVEGIEDGQMFTWQIRFAPKTKWKIIKDRLYVGYSDEYQISIFDSNGNLIKKLTKNVKREKVKSGEKEKWISETVQRLANRPRFSHAIIRKSMEKISLPGMKPVFTNLLAGSNGLIVFTNPNEEGTPAILYDENDNEISWLMFEFDDFKYFYGKYYRIINNEDAPSLLKRYLMANNKD